MKEVTTTCNQCGNVIPKGVVRLVVSGILPTNDKWQNDYCGKCVKNRTVEYLFINSPDDRAIFQTISVVWVNT